MSRDSQLSLALEPDAVVEVEEWFTVALSGRADRSYIAPVQPRDEARLLAALLLDRTLDPDDHGPWQRAVAGGMRTVRISDAPAPPS